MRELVFAADLLRNRIVFILDIITKQTSLCDILEKETVTEMWWRNVDVVEEEEQEEEKKSDREGD